MAVTQGMSEEAYEQFVLSGIDGARELHDGRLVEKPGMTWRYGRIAAWLSHLLQNQLDRRAFEVRINEGRVRNPADTIYIPDILVVPTSFGDEFLDELSLAIFSGPLPLVVEVWSPSTGDYDVDAKLPAYQQRGDLEIWRVHPCERTLTAWQRQPDGRYVEFIHREGMVRPQSLPEVAIDLAALFDD